jgi:hypothetical protein
MLAEFCRLFGRMKESDLRMVFFMAEKMARRKPVGGNLVDMKYHRE